MNSHIEIKLPWYLEVLRFLDLMCGVVGRFALDGGLGLTVMHLHFTGKQGNFSFSAIQNNWFI